MRIFKKISKALAGVAAALVMTLIPSEAFAQNVTVSGQVTDSQEEPLIGVTVQEVGGKNGVATDLDGRYTITVPKTVVLRFSYIGMKSVEIPVKGQKEINVVLTEDSNLMEELVVVGYGTQRRGSVTGSVSTVKGDEMIQTKNENPQNMLTGRIPGLRVWQKSAEPGVYANNFDVRGLGSPLVVIDGVPRTTEEFQRLNAQDIEDISVLKDASAAIYGVRAANGVVLVTTKKGTSGKAKVTYSGSFTFQKPANMPQLASVYDALTISNEQSMNNINGGTLRYTQADFDRYLSGARRTDNWNDLIIAKWSPQTQHDVTISGGSEKATYYVSFGYLYQEGIFKSGDLNYNKYNLRSNVTAELLRGLKFELNVNGMADDRKTPYTSSVDIIRNYWKQGNLFPAYADPEHTMLNYDGLDLEQNTVAMMSADISGHAKYRQKYFQSSANLTFDFGEYVPALKGLTARGMISYDYREDNNEQYRKEYYQYAYDEATDTYTQKLFNESSPSRMRREYYNKSQILGQITINYNQTFNDVHNVGAVVGWEGQKRNGDNFYAMRELAFSMPYLVAGVDTGQVGGMNSGNNDLYEFANEAFIGRINYSFDDRYLLEGQFRYDGSSKFAKGHRWGFFPSVSAGWRLSEEPFFRSISALDFINNIKIRASYGVLGDDGSLNYDWAMGYTYPSTSDNAENGYYNQYAPGYVLGSQFVNGVTPLALPNEGITWFKSKTFNVGVDFTAWNGLLGVSFDYFNRLRTGRFARRTGSLPTVVGASAPRENLDSDRQFGMELELTHRNRIGDWTYSLKGIATVTRNKYLTASEKGPWSNSYDRWRNDNLTNRYQGVQFGYESAGRFQNWNDIWTYNQYKERDLLPGDYKYLDWNGDGQIDGLDEHPYAFDQTPWLNFSLNASVAWKGIDLSLLFQGSALGSMEYKEPLYSIWGENGGGILEQYTDRWHPVDPTADPYSPSTEWVSGYYAYTGRYPKSNSSFNRVKTDYLRLKSIELGYTIPAIRALPGMSLRVYANAYNVFTWTGVKFVDPEHPDDELGRMYPLNKTYTLGMTLSF